MESAFSVSDDIIVSAQEGDQEAFGEIFELFIHSLYRFLFFQVGERKDAEVLTEEAFVRMWKNINKFSATKISFSAWVFQIALAVLSRFQDRLKKTKTVRQSTEQEREEQDFSAGNISQEQEELARAFALLPTSQATAVICKYFCNLSNTEIAEILDKTEGAVRILQSRGLKRMREFFER